MIKRRDGMKAEIRERMRGGNGSVDILHLLSGDELRGKARLCARLTLRTGCSIGYHVHENEEEVFYILSGTGVVAEEDGVDRTVGPGDAVLTGGGGGHRVRNDGPEPLEILAVILPY